MASVTQQTIESFNNLLCEQKNTQRNNTEVKVSTLLFNTKSKLIHSNCDIKDIELIDSSIYCPNDGTALYDAVGFAISFQTLLNMIRKDTNQKNIFFIFTDGYENSSQMINQKQIKDMITDLQNQGWKFTFFGGDIDTATVSDSLGISDCISLYKSDTDCMKKAFCGMSKRLKDF